MSMDRGPRARKHASIYIEPEMDIDRFCFQIGETGVTRVMSFIYKGKIGLRSVYRLSGAVTVGAGAIVR